jgi:uroporphyrinogen-III synthase
VRLLVTRPQPDAAETAARLVELGHEVLVQPMMRIAFADAPAGLSKPAAILFTSRNGVRALGRWPQAGGWRHLPVYAIGPATGAFAAQAGFADVRTGSGDAVALAGLVRRDLDPAAGTLLYPAARDRAVDPGAILDAAGYTVATVEAYRGIAADQLDADIVAAIRARRLDGILFLSRRTAAIFADLTGKAGVREGLASATLFALSEAVAASLNDLGAAEIRVAPHPDEEALIALVAAAR